MCEPIKLNDIDTVAALAGLKPLSIFGKLLKPKDHQMPDKLEDKDRGSIINVPGVGNCMYTGD